MGQGSFYMSLSFWKKVSNYAIFICGIALVAKMFFRKYIENIIWPALFVGIIAFFLFAIAELIIFILKKKSND
jgi:hypothetical protein